MACEHLHCPAQPQDWAGLLEGENFEMVHFGGEIEGILRKYCPHKLTIIYEMSREKGVLYYMF